MAVETVAYETAVFGVIPFVVDISVVRIRDIESRKTLLGLVEIRHAVGARLYLRVGDIPVL